MIPVGHRILVRPTEGIFVITRYQSEQIGGGGVLIGTVLRRYLYCTVLQR